MSDVTRSQWLAEVMVLQIPISLFKKQPLKDTFHSVLLMALLNLFQQTWKQMRDFEMKHAGNHEETLSCFTWNSQITLIPVVHLFI